MLSIEITSKLFIILRKNIPKAKISVIKLANLRLHKMSRNKKVFFRSMLESQMNQRIRSVIFHLRFRLRIAQGLVTVF